MARVAIALLASFLIGFGGAPQTPADQDTWRHAPGDRAEGSQPPAMPMPEDAVLVTLPHRVLAPNTPLWYWRQLPVPAGSALLVDADDGAQVFVDGARLDHHRRWFLVPDAPAPTRRVAIRVMNNAMQGGLRSVQVVPAASIARDRLDVRAAAAIAPVESPAFQSRMPAAGQPCRFTAWADSQGGWATFSRLAALMAARGSHFSVGVGDLVNDGSDPAAWRSFLETTAPLAARVPVVPVAGNHDYDGFYNTLRPRHYLDLFRPDGTSWFAWSCGGTRLVAIDVNAEFPIGVSPMSKQHEWLMDEVRSPAWTGATWRILLVHQPPWSRSWAGYDGDEAVRALVEPLAANHQLDLVIAGHSHAYERLTRVIGGRQLHVLITGGAGGGLETPAEAAPGTGTIVLEHHFAELAASGQSLTVEAINLDGRTIDRWRIAR
ncbi:MAG: metallophosphoesterase [Vicinamibacterales bacterium]